MNGSRYEPESRAEPKALPLEVEGKSMMSNRIGHDPEPTAYDLERLGTPQCHCGEMSGADRLLGAAADKN
jgi:hypothetical protein